MSVPGRTQVTAATAAQRAAFAACSLAADAPCPLGGQAVMEGVMMRNGKRLALAVRLPDGDILAESRPWYTLSSAAWLKRPFVRGFPTLIETLVNGIKALNRSAEHAAQVETGAELKSWHLALTLAVSVALALGLFVVLPHMFSLGMKWLGLGGDVEGLSFHAWDGLFKFAVFIGYILAISFLPDIRRVFQYHGAEHKVLRAFEACGEVSPETVAIHSRLHPRCGTTFLLFVLSISIVLHAVLVPLLLLAWTPAGAVGKHAGTMLFKFLLMAPISALAYEAIRYAARLGDGLAGAILRAPGMLLQMLTTHEPDREQIEVAIVALREALGDAAPATVRAPAYRHQPHATE